MASSGDDSELKRILDATPFLLAHCSRDLRYLYVSKACAAMIGRAPDEIVGKPIIDIIGPWWFEAIRPHVDAVLRGQQVEFEIEIHPSGVGPRQLHAIYAPDRNERGQVSGWFASILDITERKQAVRDKEQLEKLVAELRLPQEGARVGIYDRNLRTGSMSWTPELVAIYGLEADEVRGYADFHARIHPDEVNNVEARRDAAIRAGEPYQLEFRIIRPDGQVRWVMSIGGAVYDKVSGEPIRTLGSTIDITARKQAEFDREQLAKKLSLALKAARMGTWLLDLKSRRFEADSTAKALHEIPSDESFATEEQTIRHVHPDDLPDMRRKFWTAFETRGGFDVEYRVVLPNGEIRWIASQGEVPAGSPYLIGIVHDITDQKLAEAQLKQEMRDRERVQAALAQAQELETVGRLTGGVSHDINNVLAAISGNLELAMSHGIENPRALRAVQQALDAVETGANLNRKLLSFARQRKLEPVVLVLDERVRDVTELMERTLGQQITLTTNFAADLWPTRVDPAEIDNALLNLALNARDAMREGGTLSVETRNVVLDAAARALIPGAQPGEYVRLSVTDTGQGMTPEDVRRAVEPFFTTKGIGKGTGLGLSSVYGFAKQSGGFLSIESKVGEGTTVRIFLPRVAAEPAAAALPSQGQVPAGHGELILVVEDNDMVREATLGQLESLGYSVLAARNGAEAVEILKGDAPIVLVFSDIVMPGGMSGYDVARWVRKMRPGLKVLLTSGYYDGAQKPAEGLKVLEKPCTRVQLSQAIREELTGRQRQQT